MRIVHVITRLLRGGADENTILTCNGQAEAGHEVWLVHGSEFVPEACRRLAPDVRRLCASHMVHPVSPLRDMAALMELRNLLGAIAPDVVHTHTSKAGVLGRLAARTIRPRPAILHGVHILPFLNVGRGKAALYRSLEKVVAGFTDAFVSVSDGIRRENLAAGLGTEANNHVVASGMDIGAFRNAVPPADVPPHSGLVVMVAALERRKRHAEFLEVFAEVVAQRPGARLVLLGEGREQTDLKAKARALGIDRNVLFLGFREDAANWIAAADVCVLASVREGLPRASVQYVAAGKPVVITALPGIETVVRDGWNGFVVPVRDVGAMSAPILRLLEDRTLASRMGDASRSVDVSGWAVAKMVSEIESVLGNLPVPPDARDQVRGAASREIKLGRSVPGRVWSE